MKLLSTILLICLSVIVKGQDISYALTHNGSRKWVGVDKTKTLSGFSSTNIIFHANHKVEEVPVNSHKFPVTQQWQLINGNTTHDDNITIEIGETLYSVIFSKTSNGSDFITLSYTKNERVITSSYYCE